MNKVSATEARRRLLDGNERFRTNQARGPGTLAERHDSLKEGQEPFAVIVACADSRVAPEILFDCGLGELFVVRVAGNVADPTTIASIEFAVTELGTRLVVVLGHQSCGAVGAAIAGARASEHLGILLDYIEPALSGSTEDVDEVARRNARNSARKLVHESAIIREAMEAAGLVVSTAFARFSDGGVGFDD